MTYLTSCFRTLLTILLLTVAAAGWAEVTTTTDASQNATTVVSTDTTGVVKINKWSPTFPHSWGSWGTTTYKLTVKFNVRAGSKLSFDWGGKNGWYEQVDISLAGTKIVSGTYQGDYGASYEKMFKKAGTHTLVVTLQRSSYGCEEFFVKNMKIDHDAGKGPDGMLPFHLTTVTADGKFASDVQWYRIKHVNTGKYFYNNDGKVGLSTECAVDSAYYWTFTGTEKDGLWIYNMQTGAGKPMSVPERVNKGDVLLGGEGESRFLIDDNGDDYVLYMDGDTVALNATATSSYLQVYKPTTIYKTYKTNSSTKLSFINEGKPKIVNLSSIRYDIFKRVQTDEGYYDYESVSLTNGTLALMEGDQIEINATALPENATDKALAYSLDKTGVIKVDESKQENDGCYITATALKGGECVLTILGANRPQVKREIPIKVTGKVRVSSITFDTDTMYIGVGDMRQVNVSVMPKDAYDRTLKWSNTKPNVAIIGSDGLLYGMAPGTTVLTAKANDDSGKSAKLVVVCLERDQNAPVEHDTRYLYASGEDGSLMAIPLSYIEQKTFTGSTLSLRLKGGIQQVMKDVKEVSDVCPVELPRFTSYKFNNKFNDQLFTDAVAEEGSLMTADTIRIPVACIGKRLTASFQMDNDTLARAWVGKVRQHSKETRQRFDHPITYTLGHKNWKALELVEDAQGHARVDTIPFGSQVTVVVDWLTDRSKSPYSVPRIDITFGSGAGWSGSQWIGQMGKDTYVDASVKINGYGVFPDMEETNILIKGRGNSSWSNSYSSKNPYHFKFEEKQKPLGMKAGKHWLLLANKQNGSMTTNAIAHRAAALLGMAYPCHIVPVDLYINGSYRGSYNLTERIGLGNNSVDLDDDSNAAIIELDTYTDERIIHEQCYYLPVKLKDPDDVGGIHQAAVNAFQTLTETVMTRGDYDQMVDLEKLASFLLTNELILNCEIKHPKSVFAYNENIYDTEAEKDPTPWVFGPLWDCDWAFGYQQSQSYFVSSADLDYFTQMGRSDNYGDSPRQFWSSLRSGSQALDKIMYSRLFHFVTMGGLDELLEYCDDYYQFAKASLEHNKLNATSQTDSSSNYGSQTSNAKSWLAKRAASMFSRYEAYDLSDDEDADQHPTDAILATQDGYFAKGVIYNLQGRRMHGQLPPGIFLRDGKKFIVR